jgi:hypothetical protein
VLAGVAGCRIWLSGLCAGSGRQAVRVRVRKTIPLEKLDMGFFRGFFSAQLCAGSRAE